MENGRSRVIIQNVKPNIDNGQFPIKRVTGESVVVTADAFADGHDVLSVRLRYRGPSDPDWISLPMSHHGNDHWMAEFTVKEVGTYRYTIEGWVDQFQTWRESLRKKHEAGQDLSVAFAVGAELLALPSEQARGKEKAALSAAATTLRAGSSPEKCVELAFGDELPALLARHDIPAFPTKFGRDLEVLVERPKALFSTWYERFPRSCAPKPGVHGTFKDCQKILPEVARMGFDVFYLPPIHPIGKKNRKGKNNAPSAQTGDVGSPWAIGSDEGGHTALHPKLGTMDDFRALIAEARRHGIEIAMDIAFQCAPDHPAVREHPEWFKWLPDGSVQHAENPPKKYEDIIPYHFESDDWQALHADLLNIVLTWAREGVRIFRVDNPHTKPFQFWVWLIDQARKQYPDLLFLAEAFTRPNVMYYLAKAGFSQSYTYFTWRNSKAEFTDYVTHLLNTEVREYFRANFWPNTPDILPEHLQFGGRPAFIMRLVLAATLSSNYGIYGPPFELCVSTAFPGKEEYLDSEKYEIRSWDWNADGNIKDIIARVNAIRRENPALQTTWNLRFYEVENDYLIAYGKADPDLTNIILVIVNLDPAHTQAGWITVPLEELGITPGQPYMVQDLLSGDRFIWHGARNMVEINPHAMPAQIFRIRKRLRRESDFDYYF